MNEQLTPLGRGPVLTDAQVSELNAFKEFRAVLDKVGPVNSPAAALAHRDVNLQYARALDAMGFNGRRNREESLRLCFTQCGLSVTV